MLTIPIGRRSRNCDRISRRDALQVGALGLSSLSLANLLRCKAAAGQAGPEFMRDKAVVMVFLGGGPSHIETFNPNFGQPAPYHSVTGEVKTSLPGVTFGGNFPLLAQHADKMAIVRSFKLETANHSLAVPYLLTGGHVFSGSIGSAYMRIRGTNHAVTGMPTYGLVTAPEIGRYANPKKRIIDASQPRELGAAYAPFEPNGTGPALDNMKLKLSPQRIGDRRALLAALDNAKRTLEGQAATSGIDGFRQQAYDLILGAVAEATDLSKEDPRLLARYDTGQFRIGEKDFRDCTLGRQLLMARRLVEAGCGFVTVQCSGWDMHGGSGNNYLNLPTNMKMLGEPLDKALSAFLEDITQRGLLDKTLLVVTGDFGRTPNINKNGGRDHWSSLGTLALAGGGLRMGQVIGQTDRTNGYPATEPIQAANLMSTIMHTLLDIGQVRITRGVPRNLLEPLEKHAPIRELF